MVNLSKGIPVRFTEDDRYVFRVDTTTWSKNEEQALRNALLDLDVDWYEGYMMPLVRSSNRRAKT